MERLRVAAPVPGRRDGLELLVGAFQSLYDPIARRYTHYALFHSRFTLWLILFPVGLVIFIASSTSPLRPNRVGLRHLGRRRRTYETEPIGTFLADVRGVVSTNAVAASIFPKGFREHMAFFVQRERGVLEATIRKAETGDEQTGWYKSIAARCPRVV